MSETSKPGFSFTAEMTRVISETPFVALATVSREGEPHVIIVGGGKVREDKSLVFEIHHMKRTLTNISENGILKVVAAKEYKGFRFSGKAHVSGKELILLVDSAEALL
jgi:uncharacterized protein